LIGLVRGALADLAGALKGSIIMSLEIEDTLEAVRKASIPLPWLLKGYPSDRTLPSYIKNLAARVDFFNKWIETGLPTSFWLSGFFNHHSFIAAIKQNFARANNCSIDEVDFEFSVLAPEQEVGEGEVAVHGLSLEGAQWDEVEKQLAESSPRQQYAPLPPVKLQPCQAKRAEEAKKGKYCCPVYVNQARWGEVDTIGHSTNFIFNIWLPSREPGDHWVARGVAALCQIDTLDCDKE